MLVVAEPSTASSSAIVWCWLCASALLLEAACSASGSGDMARASAAFCSARRRARAPLASVWLPRKCPACFSLLTPTPPFSDYM